MLTRFYRSMDVSIQKVNKTTNNSVLSFIDQTIVIFRRYQLDVIIKITNGGDNKYIKLLKYPIQ